MARPLRIEYPGAWHHVMNRGTGHKKIFRGDDDYRFFLSLLEDATTRFGAEIHSYCLMGNHYHLLAKTPEANLQRIMRHVNGLYTQHYNKAMKTDGPLFRGRYKAILVESDRYLLDLSRYIHRNPLDALDDRTVKQLSTYSWSSYAAYIGTAKPPAWLRTEEVYDQLGGQRRAAGRYQAFVEGDAETELETFYGKKAFSPILGSESFRQRMIERYAKQDKEVVEQKSLRGIPSSSRITRQVANFYSIKPEEITSPSFGRGGRRYPRLIAMYLCQRVGRMSLHEIADLFGVGHYASVSNAIGQLRKDVARDEHLQGQLLQLTREITQGSSGTGVFDS